MACALVPQGCTLKPNLEACSTSVGSKGRRARSSHLGTQPEKRYTHEQAERLREIHERLIEARRELDALIGDAYLRPRASIVPVHFLDLASAVEKLRWAEKEWRELDKESQDGGDVDEPATSGLVEALPAEAPGN